ncbi:hypothetical protein DD594_26525, partial [Enterobacter cloacae complex sp. 4DZ1-17B1]|uniref:hypothetical protein n=1 Tax=Enterobacter cloacae complex sp. 4DZ1-17B1 TaxID=2511991 RepID=UPI001025DA68
MAKIIPIFLILLFFVPSSFGQLRKSQLDSLEHFYKIKDFQNYYLLARQICDTSKQHKNFANIFPIIRTHFDRNPKLISP